MDNPDASEGVIIKGDGHAGMVCIEGSSNSIEEFIKEGISREGRGKDKSNEDAERSTSGEDNGM